MTVTFISAEPITYLVEYGELLQLRVRCQATGNYWLWFGIKPESIDPYAYDWDMGELYGPFPASQTEVILSRYVPAEWEPPADTRWLLQAVVSYNETGYTNEGYLLSDIMRNVFSYGAPLMVSLRISISGEGTTTPAPLPDVHYYNKYDEIILTAIPYSGWKFDHWGGDASGTSTSITLVMDSDKNITAYFLSGEPPEDGGLLGWIEEHALELGIGGLAVAGIILAWPKGK